MKKKILAISLIVIIGVLGVLTPFVIKSIKNKNSNTFNEYQLKKLDVFKEENNSIIECDVVFVGDSLTDGYPISEFYSELKAYNRGIGGDRTKDVLNRMEISIYNAKPKVVVILIGGNDVLAGKSESYIIKNYKEILNGIKNNLPNTEIIIQSNYPLANDYASKNKTMLSLNTKLKDIASKNGLTYVDLYTPLLDKTTNELILNYTPDSVHLNVDGYKVVTSVLKPIILEKLK